MSEETVALLQDEFNRLRGRLCGAIESFGLPEKQERSAITLLKSLSYDSEKLLKDILEDSD